VRRVRRTVRSVDTWTVFKVATIFFAAVYIILLVAGVILWNVAQSTGTIDNVERFFESFGWETFEFNGGELYHSYWIIGAFLAVAGVGASVTMAVLFNLIADLVGGIGVTVLEHEVVVVRAEHAPAPDSPPIEHLDPSVWDDVTGGTFRPSGS
jgi:Transmembrane domain of unknown function (DUF3566)